MWKGGGQMNIDVIEEKRKKNRVTITELCKAVDIERSTYYRLLKKPDTMKFSTWQKIADFLCLTQSERKAALM